MTTPTEREAMLALADEYEAGFKKAIASGYEEFGKTWELQCQLVIKALRLAASPPAAGSEALREALKPFAKLAEFVSDDHRDSRPIIHGLATSLAERLTIGHLRAARAALTTESPDDQGPDPLGLPRGEQ
jgi:hypothetical protein